MSNDSVPEEKQALWPTRPTWLQLSWCRFPDRMCIGIFIFESPRKILTCDLTGDYAQGEMKIISHIIVPYTAYSKAERA